MDSLTVNTLIPEGYRKLYSPFLYNLPDFLEANNSLPQLHFYLLDKLDKTVLGHIAFSREEEEVLSPYKAPFGGFELAGTLAGEAVTFFLAEVLRKLKELSIRFVRLKLPPPCYSSGVTLMAESLLDLGFEARRKLEHHVLSVTEEELTLQMATMEQRKLKKARKAGLTFSFEEPNKHDQVFDFIRTHREARGHQLSLGWQALKEMKEQLPDHYLFATVCMQERIVAAAIMVRASASVLYYFFPVHDQAFNHLSPMVFLLNEMYNWAQQQGLAYIDLGTSYIDGKPNSSLIKFKEHMGGKPQESSVFRKALSS